MNARKRNRGKTRRRVHSATIRVVNSLPPPAVMTCDRCGAAGINEDWLVLTRELGKIGPDDLGLCPACVLIMFGPRAFRDPGLLARAQRDLGRRAP